MFRLLVVLQRDWELVPDGDAGGDLHAWWAAG